MRSRTAAYSGLFLAGLIGCVASAQPWWQASGEGTTVGFTGFEATGGLSQALAAVVLAGTLLVLALRVRGRQVVGVLLALVTAAMALVGALQQRPSDTAVQTRLRQVSLIDQFGVTSTGWPWIYAVAGALGLTAASITVIRATRWPRRPDRFQRGLTPTSAAEAADDPALAWKALDAGLDPTIDPDVHAAGIRDTMGSNQQTEHPTGRTSTSPE